MADKLLIVHGYSDGSTSFTALGNFLTKRGLYQAKNVFYLDYSSMDDDATFEDFADKLDADHRARLGKERVDVRYLVSTYDAYDPAQPLAKGEPMLLCENTTTLVDVVLNRLQTDKLLEVKDGGLQSIAIAAAAAAPAAPAPTGRAAVVAHEAP